MNCCFGYDVGVEPIAKVNGINVITSGEHSFSIFHQSMCGLENSSGLVYRIRFERKLYPPFQIAVHNCEKHLQEKVHSVDQHCQKIQPCFSRHHLESAAEPSHSLVLQGFDNL